MSVVKEGIGETCGEYDVDCWSDNERTRKFSN